MKNQYERNHTRKVLALLSAVAAILLLLMGCKKAGGVKLDPKNPVTVTVWHYYNSAIMNAFESMVKEFNETVGTKEGIIIEGYGMGNVIELEKAVAAAANKEVGSGEMPNIFASYADMAYELEKMDLLANLDDYFTKEEQEEYLESYIEEGKIGTNGELRIFPIAKATETFTLNETDWLPFAEANELTYDDLATMEGVTEVAEIYYHWTDSLTPETPHDGKSFFGRDVMANLFIIASKEFGTEIFRVENGLVTLDVNEGVMRKIWDDHYVPFISGYFSANGKYRSDDTKVGDILAYVGSTASVAYFPKEVTVGGKVYPVQAKVLPFPHFQDGRKVMVQQGAGMVVTKSTPEEEYASTVFLKWFTEKENNIVYAALSGYTPVKKEAVEYNTFIESLHERGHVLDDITNETLKRALEEITTSELYTNKAFGGGVKARAVLEHHLQDKAVADKEAVDQLIASGMDRQQAVEQFNTEDNFQKWLDDMTFQLNEAIQ